MKIRRAFYGLFFLATALFLNFVVPPFQNPDEPQHFIITMVYAQGEEHRDEVEAEVIRLMDKYNWWKHGGLVHVGELPESLSQIPVFQKHFSGKDFRAMHKNIVLYHFALGKILGFFYRGSIETAYFICRLVSILFAAGAIFLVYVSFKKIGERESVFPLAFLFILFLPQFFQTALTVSSDALAVLLGSLFFYAVLSLMAGEMKGIFFVWLIGAAVLGFFTDRSVFVLLPLLVLLPFFIIKKEKYKESIVNVLAFLVVTLMLVGIVANLFPLHFENSLDLFEGNVHKVGKALPGLFSFSSFEMEFFSTIMDSFFLKYGWMAFGLGILFAVFWRSLVMVSLAGIVVLLGKRGWNVLRKWPEWVTRFKKALGFKKAQRKWRRIEANTKKSFGNRLVGKLTLFFALTVLFQVTAAWTYYGRQGILAQGRQFFPLIIPIGFLFVVGVKRTFDVIRPGLGKVVVVGFVVVEFLVLTLVIWAQMVPFFHMIIKSPYYGI